jgi:hypothetical protein
MREVCEQHVEVQERVCMKSEQLNGGDLRVERALEQWKIAFSGTRELLAQMSGSYGSRCSRNLHQNDSLCNGFLSTILFDTSSAIIDSTTIVVTASALNLRKMFDSYLMIQSLLAVQNNVGFGNHDIVLGVHHFGAEHLRHIE